MNIKTQFATAKAILENSKCDFTVALEVMEIVSSIVSEEDEVYKSNHKDYAKLVTVGALGIGDYLIKDGKIIPGFFKHYDDGMDIFIELSKAYAYLLAYSTAMADKKDFSIGLVEVYFQTIFANFGFIGMPLDEQKQLEITATKKG